MEQRVQLDVRALHALVYRSGHATPESIQEALNEAHGYGMHAMAAISMVRAIVLEAISLRKCEDAVLCAFVALKADRCR